MEILLNRRMPFPPKLRWLYVPFLQSLRQVGVCTSYHSRLIYSHTEDILVQNFLNHSNYQYYCLYPPTFSQAYSVWWADRASGKTLRPDFTCLLLRVCACSTQSLDVFCTTENSYRLWMVCTTHGWQRAKLKERMTVLYIGSNYILYNLCFNSNQ